MEAGHNERLSETQAAQNGRRVNLSAVPCEVPESVCINATVNPSPRLPAYGKRKDHSPAAQN
jgi:hypothetical protein